MPEDNERLDPPLAADEKTMLAAWLDWHRATLATKCAGLAASQLRERSATPSTLSLHGLVRHMAEVERAWFRRCLDGEDAALLYCSKEDPDGDFDGVDSADFETDEATWRSEIDNARRVLAGIESLDRTGQRRGEKFSARWVLVHMVEEYARHNGHADLLRERIDGSTGD